MLHFILNLVKQLVFENLNTILDSKLLNSIIPRSQEHIRLRSIVPRSFAGTQILIPVVGEQKQAAITNIYFTTLTAASRTFEDKKLRIMVQDTRSGHAVLRQVPAPVKLDSRDDTRIFMPEYFFFDFYKINYFHVLTYVFSN